MPSTRETIIIGAGIAGLCSAVERIWAGKKVRIKEANSKVASATSNTTACRISVGAHTKDAATALKQLDDGLALIDFLKKLALAEQAIDGIAIPDPNAWQKYLRDEGEPELGPKRGCTYLRHPDSQSSESELDALYLGTLKTAYAEFCKRNPDKQHYGSPEQFVRKLSSKELDHYGCLKDGKPYPAGYHFAERFGHVPRIRDALLKVIRNSPDAKLELNQEIRSISHSSDKPGFDLTVYDVEAKTNKTEYAEIIEVSAWQNTNKLIAGLGFPSREGLETTRVKAMSRVVVPEELAKEGAVVVVHGAFTAFSNVGNIFNPESKDTEFLITAEEITNRFQTTSIILPPQQADILAGKMPAGEQKQLSEKITATASEFFCGSVLSKLKEAKHVEIRFGAVITLGGHVDLNDPQSDHHKRVVSGVERAQVGIYPNRSMKFCNAPGNAQEVGNLMDCDESLQANIEKLAPEIAQSCYHEAKQQAIFYHMLTKNWQRYLRPQRAAASPYINYSQSSFSKEGKIVEEKKREETATLDELSNPVTRKSIVSTTIAMVALRKNLNAEIAKYIKKEEKNFASRDVAKIGQHLLRRQAVLEIKSESPPPDMATSTPCDFGDLATDVVATRLLKIDHRL